MSGVKIEGSSIEVLWESYTIFEAHFRPPKSCEFRHNIQVLTAEQPAALVDSTKFPVEIGNPEVIYMLVKNIEPGPMFAYPVEAWYFDINLTTTSIGFLQFLSLIHISEPTRR